MRIDNMWFAEVNELTGEPEVYSQACIIMEKENNNIPIAYEDEKTKQKYCYAGLIKTNVYKTKLDALLAAKEMILRDINILKRERESGNQDISASRNSLKKINRKIKRLKMIENN